jgi:myosin V
MTSQIWKENTINGLGKGSRVWYRSESRKWELATLQSTTRDFCSLAPDFNFGEGTGKSVDVKIGDILPANPAMLELVPNLTDLSFLNEPSILHTLRQRYASDVIYTHAGPVLIAINPFKRIDLYTGHHVQRYVNRPVAGTQSAASEYEPHIFLTADKAFKQVRHLLRLNST